MVPIFLPSLKISTPPFPPWGKEKRNVIENVTGGGREQDTGAKPIKHSFPRNKLRDCTHVIHMYMSIFLYDYKPLAFLTLHFLGGEGFVIDCAIAPKQKNSHTYIFREKLSPLLACLPPFTLFFISSLVQIFIFFLLSLTSFHAGDEAERGAEGKERKGKEKDAVLCCTRPTDVCTYVDHVDQTEQDRRERGIPLQYIHAYVYIYIFGSNPPGEDWPEEREPGRRMMKCLSTFILFLPATLVPHFMHLFA